MAERSVVSENSTNFSFLRTMRFELSQPWAVWVIIWMGREEPAPGLKFPCSTSTLLPPKIDDQHERGVCLTLAQGIRSSLAYSKPSALWVTSNPCDLYMLVIIDSTNGKSRFT